MWREIEDLRKATVGELRAKYLDLFGQPSHSNHKQFLFRRVAWRLQALAYGELSEHARQRAAALAQDVDLRIKAPEHLVGAPQQILQPTLRSQRKAGRDDRLPVPGTILRREFKGDLVVVQVLKTVFNIKTASINRLALSRVRSPARRGTDTTFSAYH